MGALREAVCPVGYLPYHNRTDAFHLAAIHSKKSRRTTKQRSCRLFSTKPDLPTQRRSSSNCRVKPPKIWRPMWQGSLNGLPIGSKTKKRTIRIFDAALGFVGCSRTSYIPGCTSPTLVKAPERSVEDMDLFSDARRRLFTIENPHRLSGDISGTNTNIRTY